MYFAWSNGHYWETEKLQFMVIFGDCKYILGQDASDSGGKKLSLTQQALSSKTFVKANHLRDNKTS